MLSTPSQRLAEHEARLQALYRYQILDSDIDPAFDAITELAAMLCDTPIAVINFIDKDRQWFKSEIGLGTRETPLDVSICEHALGEEEILVVPDTEKDPRFVNNPLVTGEPRLRFYAGALLKNDDGHVLGTLCVLDQNPRTISEKQQKALIALAQQVMAKLELIKLIEEQKHLLEQLEQSRRRLERQASTDPLTGLLNRRAINTALSHELQLLPAMERETCILLLDLDFFKDINDTYGYTVGDDVLRNFAALCRQAFRKSDLISRWGGEEFLVLLPGASMEAAQMVVDRLRDELTKRDLNEEHQLKVTFSAGLIEIGPFVEEEALFTQLDRLMHEAKSTGRNQTIAFCMI
ncbi:sensor domain-containing diguanylate cyclase [Aliidiomarina sanyensis]|uniref:Sensor domain-containing diguanylate cyclase n=2 Tax=Aliidiomarina sanyensis TaxID=1249555 RepID=A0A432WG71_9GAMM|nr:sensor domain-containing diguanylate cyclase [Aliidiomarina sanyensis]